MEARGRGVVVKRRERVWRVRRERVRGARLGSGGGIVGGAGKAGCGLGSGRTGDKVCAQCGRCLGWIVEMVEADER